MAFTAWQPCPATQTCRIATSDDPFATDAGAQLADVELAYETWGRLNNARDNVVLIFHALTGDAHAASHPEAPGDRPGWWEPLLGPGRPLDTERYFRHLCEYARFLLWLDRSTFARAGWPTLESALPGTHGARSRARAALRLLERLGIGRLRCVLGGSLGGMESLELITLAPTLAARAVRGGRQRSDARAGHRL